MHIMLENIHFLYKSIGRSFPTYLIEGIATNTNVIHNARLFNPSSVSPFLMKLRMGTESSNAMADKSCDVCVIYCIADLFELGVFNVVSFKITCEENNA